MLILNRMKNFIPFVLLSLFSILGGFLVYKTIEVFGPLITPDSVNCYLQPAENFKNGYGVSVRDADGFKTLTRWPPLYPVILSFFDDFRLLNSILAFIASFVFGFIVFDATKSIMASVLSIILFSLSPTYIYIFSHLWSETLSLPFVLLTCVLIKKYLDRPSFYSLFLFSISISISPLIRYPNLFFILAILLIFFIYRLKLSQLIMSVILSSLGFIFLLLRIYFSPNTQGPPAKFSLSIHLLPDFHLPVLIKTLRDYILPEQSAYWHPILIPITIVGLGLGILLLIFSKRNKLIFSNWEKILIVSGASYLLLIFIVISIMDYYNAPDKRILSPFFVFMLAFLFIFLYKISQFKLGSLIIYFTILLAYLPYTKDFVEISRKGLQWKLNYPPLSNLHIIEETRKLPQDAYIYSNAPDLIYLHTKRFASSIPAKFFFPEKKPFPNFQDEIKKMATKLKEKDGFLVLIYPYSRPYLPTEDELNSLLDLQVYKRTQDGVIYKVRP